MSCAIRTACPTSIHACGRQLTEQRNDDISRKHCTCSTCMLVWLMYCSIKALEGMS